MIRLVKFRQLDGFVDGEFSVPGLSGPGLYAESKSYHVSADSLKTAGGEVLSSEISIDKEGFATVYILFEFPKKLFKPTEGVVQLLQEGGIR